MPGTPRLSKPNTSLLTRKYNIINSLLKQPVKPTKEDVKKEFLVFTGALDTFQDNSKAYIASAVSDKEATEVEEFLNRKLAEYKPFIEEVKSFLIPSEPSKSGSQGTDISRLSQKLLEKRAKLNAALAVQEDRLLIMEEENKLEARRREEEAKLEARRREANAKLEAQRIEIEKAKLLLANKEDALEVQNLEKALSCTSLDAKSETSLSKRTGQHLISTMENLKSKSVINNEENVKKLMISTLPTSAENYVTEATSSLMSLTNPIVHHASAKNVQNIEVEDKQRSMVAGDPISKEVQFEDADIMVSNSKSAYIMEPSNENPCQKIFYPQTTQNTNPSGD